MSAFRKLKAVIVGTRTMGETRDDLRAAAIPVSDEACRGCADPCDEGHDEYPKFDVDMETEMLGSVKPYSRQVVISTGKSDWQREVTDVRGTLAYHLSSASSDSKGERSASPETVPAVGPPIPGVFAANPRKYGKTTILNGSHRTLSQDDKETVLIFPDYKVITEVEASAQAATELWQHAVSPRLPLHPAPTDSGKDVQSWVIPYSCVILLCSHKKRDNRCAIAAPKLEHGLTRALEHEGWEVHTQLEDPSVHDKPLEQIEGTDDEKTAEIRRRLQQVPVEHAKRALILYCSHIGGHKFAGNVIIHTPRGTSIWYGRVTPHEVDAVVKETIIGGRILPALLRGGMGLSCPGKSTLNDW